jgi:hypothetical protein
VTAIDRTESQYDPRLKAMEAEDPKGALAGLLAVGGAGSGGGGGEVGPSRIVPHRPMLQKCPRVRAFGSAPRARTTRRRGCRS